MLTVLNVRMLITNINTLYTLYLQLEMSMIAAVGGPSSKTFVEIINREDKWSCEKKEMELDRSKPYAEEV